MSALDPLAPFVDDSLVTLRAAQRKRLADVPDWVIDGLRHGIPHTELPLSDVGLGLLLGVAGQSHSIVPVSQSFARIGTCRANHSGERAGVA